VDNVKRSSFLIVTVGTKRWEGEKKTTGTQFKGMKTLLPWEWVKMELQLIRGERGGMSLPPNGGEERQKGEDSVVKFLRK